MVILMMPLVKMMKFTFGHDDGEDEGGRDEILEFRSRLECGFM